MIITRDEAFRVVCSTLTPHPDGTAEVGTGVFLTTDNHDAWLITASHVAKSTNAATTIAVGDENSNCIAVPMALFDSSLNWRYHPIADIAALKIGVNERTIGLIKNRCLPYDHFNLSQTSVSRDAELTSVGFPNGLGTAGKFSPLTFRSYASSALITMNRFDTGTPSDFFCLENPSCGGYSGCPVFDLGYMVVGAMTTTKEKTVCHGIMHGTLGDSTGGKLAVVTPAFYLKDLIP